MSVHTRLIGGRFATLEQFQTGGAGGQTYRARDEQASGPQADVVLKLSTNSDSFTQIVVEATALQRLETAWLTRGGKIERLPVPRLAAGQSLPVPTSSPPAFFAEELIGPPYQPLAELLANGPAQWSVLHALEVASTLGDLFTLAHADGIVHGDLNATKIEHVFWDPAGRRLKVIDWGLADVAALGYAARHGASNDIVGVGQVLDAMLQGLGTPSAADQIAQRAMLLPAQGGYASAADLKAALDAALAEQTQLLDRLSREFRQALASGREQELDGLVRRARQMAPLRPIGDGLDRLRALTVDVERTMSETRNALVGALTDLRLGVPRGRERLGEAAASARRVAALGDEIRKLPRTDQTIVVRALTPDAQSRIKRSWNGLAALLDELSRERLVVQWSETDAGTLAETLASLEFEEAAALLHGSASLVPDGRARRTLVLRLLSLRFTRMPVWEAATLADEAREAVDRLRAGGFGGPVLAALAEPAEQVRKASSRMQRATTDLPHLAELATSLAEANSLLVAGLARPADAAAPLAELAAALAQASEARTSGRYVDARAALEQALALAPDLEAPIRSYLMTEQQARAADAAIQRARAALNALARLPSDPETRACLFGIADDWSASTRRLAPMLTEARTSLRVVRDADAASAWASNAERTLETLAEKVHAREPSLAMRLWALADIGYTAGRGEAPAAQSPGVARPALDALQRSLTQLAETLDADRFDPPFERLPQTGHLRAVVGIEAAGRLIQRAPARAASSIAGWSGAFEDASQRLSMARRWLEEIANADHLPSDHPIRLGAVELGRSVQRWEAWARGVVQAIGLTREHTAADRAVYLAAILTSSPPDPAKPADADSRPPSDLPPNLAALRRAFREWLDRERSSSAWEQPESPTLPGAYAAAAAPSPAAPRADPNEPSPLRARGTPDAARPFWDTAAWTQTEWIWAAGAALVLLAVFLGVVVLGSAATGGSVLNRLRGTQPAATASPEAGTPPSAQPASSKPAAADQMQAGAQPNPAQPAPKPANASGNVPAVASVPTLPIQNLIRSCDTNPISLAGLFEIEGCGQTAPGALAVFNAAVPTSEEGRWLVTLHLPGQPIGTVGVALHDQDAGQTFTLERTPDGQVVPRRYEGGEIKAEDKPAESKAALPSVKLDANKDQSLGLHLRKEPGGGWSLWAIAPMGSNPAPQEQRTGFAWPDSTRHSVSAVGLIYQPGGNSNNGKPSFVSSEYEQK